MIKRNIKSKQFGTSNQKILSRRGFLKLGGITTLSLILAARSPSPASTITLAPTSPPLSGEQIKSTHDVIIIGAGIAGLSAAYFLKDYTIKVLEKNNRVGGRTISGIYQGFKYAKGTEYLGRPEGALEKIIAALKIQPREIPSPMDAHFKDGKFYYGENGLALMYAEQSSLDDYNRFVSTMRDCYKQYNDVPEFDLNSPLAQLDNVSVRKWFDQHAFPAIFYDTYNVTARGLFGATIDEISALSFIPEIAFDFEDSTPVESIKLLRKSHMEMEDHTEAYSFATGITEITDAIAQYLKDAIQLNSTVTSIIQQDTKYLVTYTDRNGNIDRLDSDVVILAAPAPITLKVAPTILSHEQQMIMGQIPYSTYLTVELFSQKPVFNKAFDLAVPDGYFFTDLYDSTWIQRFYNPSLRKKKEDVMSVYIPPKGYRDRSLIHMSDEDILKNIYADLEKIFPGVRNKIVGYDICRFPFAYPVMTLGAYKRLSRLNEITDGRFLLAGDFMIYPTFEAAAQSGYLAAQKAKGKLREQ